MSELNWIDVVQNPQQYPDEMLLRDLGDQGKQLVELRRSVVPRSHADAALHRERQRAEAYAAEKTTLEQQLAYALAGKGEDAETRRRGDAETRQTSRMYETDPILNPLYTEAHSAFERTQQHEREMAALRAETERLKSGLAQIPTILRLEQLRQVDPNLNPAQLLQFAQSKQQQPDLADFHRLMTYDAALARAKEEGIQAGLERAKQDLIKNPQVPYAPYGPPQGTQPQAPQFENMEQAEAAMLQDPEIIGLFYN